MAQDKSYTIFHMHSDISNGVTNIDSITKYNQYIDLIAENNMKSFGFAEHGYAGEWCHKKQYADKLGLKYIHAVEVYLTDNLIVKHRDNFHCVLIAKNYDGVLELNKLVSQSFNRSDNHFYYVPRISLYELFNTSDNIIVTTACLGSILHNGTDRQKEKMLNFMHKNKHRCFLEIAHHISEEQKQYNLYLLNMSKQYNLELIAGTDTHALNQTHAEGRLMLQKAKGIHFDNEDEFDITFKTYDELCNAYKEQDCLPEDIYLTAINNTNVLSDMVEDFKLDNTPKYPKFDGDSLKEFRKKIYEGYKLKGIDKLPNVQEYNERIKYEIETYQYNNSIDFMLLEEDYKTQMRNQGIYCGYSRGSVSGSVVAYLLGITDVDSIKFNLNFERFASKDRVSLADIDSDWFSGDREVVKEYLYNRHDLYCCDIITYNTIALKGAFKDIARAFNVPIEEANSVTSDIELREDEYRNKYPEIFKYVDMVQNTIVSIGTHSSATVVSPMPIDNWFGTISTANNKYPVSQLNMKEIDSLNFVKLDILSLDNIALINNTCKTIGIDRLTPDNLDFLDVDVWESIAENTTGIFQMESSMASAYLKKMFSENTLNNIKQSVGYIDYIYLMAMANGAIRPAGASYRNELSEGIFRDNGHEVLNDFLKPTLGYLVFQEQIIEFLHKFCGYTMGEADIIRRGFAKKTGTEKYIPNIKSGFIKTMKEKYGVTESESEELITNFICVISDASDYLFSLNHSIPYSQIGYACGWLRYYYPLEFITTALNIFGDKEDKSLEIISYARQKGITIYTPKFRKSNVGYTFDKTTNSIYKGIDSIKYLNITVAQELYDMRNETFENFVDLLYHIKQLSINTKQLDILIKLNYFVEFGHINYLLAVVEIFDKFYKCKTLKKTEGAPLWLYKKYSEKETEKTFSGIDNRGLINELCESQSDLPAPILSEMVAYQVTMLGYADIIDENAESSFYAVEKIEKNQWGSVFATIYQLNSGARQTLKVDRKWYEDYPCDVGNIINAVISAKEKYRKVEGEKRMQPTGEYERYLKLYSILN